MEYHSYLVLQIQTHELSPQAVFNFSLEELTAPLYDEATLLHVAAYWGTAELLDAVIAALSQYNKALEMALLPITMSIEIEGRTRIQWTPLALAVFSKKCTEDTAVNKVTSLLTLLGPKATTVCQWPMSTHNLFDDIRIEGVTVLHLVAHSSNQTLLELILSTLGNNVTKIKDLTHFPGWTPLYFMIENTPYNPKGIGRLVHALGSEASHCCTLSTKEGWTPLHSAVCKQSLETIDLLLTTLGQQAKKMCALITDTGYTTLSLAVYHQRSTVVERLLLTLKEKALDVCKYANHEGWTALHYSIVNGCSLDITQQLLTTLDTQAATIIAAPFVKTHRINKVKTKDPNWTLLHECATFKDEARAITLFKLLLAYFSSQQQNSLLNREGQDHETPLSLANNSHPNIAKFLHAVVTSQNES